MLAADAFPGVHVIDTDAHWSEPHDLWTSRAPAKYRDRVPQPLVGPDGRRRWYVDRDIPISSDSAFSVIAPNGEKLPGLEFVGHDIDQVHRASSQAGARVELLDEIGIRAQVLYPNVAGFGNQRFLSVGDKALREACVQIYNDAMAEVQAESGDRLLPMAVVPWWDIPATVREVERCHSLGMRGIVMCSNPHDAGFPAFNQPEWKPFWEACEALALPINFHIGASEGDVDFFGRVPYASWPGEVRIALGGATMFLGNCRWMANLLVSDIPEEHPGLSFVSVESGVGWLPFLLEGLDYQIMETAPTVVKRLPLKPSEYFRRQFFGTFWFESAANVGPAIEYLGPSQVMFETDFPHPTCLYPDAMQRTKETIGSLPEEVQRMILQENAAALYRVELP